MTQLSLTLNAMHRFIPSLAISAEEPPDGPPPPRDQDAQADKLAGLAALIVEDEYLVGLEMVQTLRSWGMNVTGPVQTLKDAVAASDASHWDCAILDVNLDGADTLDLARKLRARGVLVVFVTAYANNDRRFAGDLSVIPRLGKPIPYRTLRRIIIDAIS